MATPGQVLCSVIVAVLLVDKSEAIMCYYCNSANNSACVDVNLFAEYNIVPLVNCETAISTNIGVNFFCRKIVQTILNPGHDSQVRVTRGCGWVKHHRECYTADNEDHLETVCQCFNDQCNAAPHPAPSAALLALLALLALVSTAAVSLARSDMSV